MPEIANTPSGVAVEPTERRGWPRNSPMGMDLLCRLRTAAGKPAPSQAVASHRTPGRATALLGEPPHSWVSCTLLGEPSI